MEQEQSIKNTESTKDNDNSVSQKIITDNTILTWYMEDALETSLFPNSTYSFCKKHHIEESLFYEHFSDIKILKQEVWATLAKESIRIVKESSDFENFSPKEKLLSLYYTLFENFNLNRSYLLMSLGNVHKLENLIQLKSIRSILLEYYKELILEGNEQKTLKFSKHPEKIFSQGAWIQFLFLLNFWRKDHSKRFEKTDIAIEKSVNTALDVFNTAPVDSIIDLGKFLWQQHKK